MKAIALRRILCPTNFADGAQRTVEGAAILAALYDAELRLFHVASGSQGTREEEHRDAESLIASLFALTRRIPARTRVSAALAHGDPAAEIVQHACLMRADLILLGSEHPLPAGIRGTVSARIAALARCPVLYVRPSLLPSLSENDPGFTEILCCRDSVPGRRTGEDYAHALAHRLHARVTVLDVIDDEIDSTDGATTGIVPKRNLVRVSLTGQPGPEIVALARQLRADLIVVGTQDGPSMVDGLGSTTAHVMEHAPCAVLIVPRSSSSRFHVTSSGAGVIGQPLQNEMTATD